MGKAVHPKIIARVRELLRKIDLTIPMIATRTGISASLVRNIKLGRDAHKHPSPDDEIDHEFVALLNAKPVAVVPTASQVSKSQEKGVPNSHPDRDMFDDETPAMEPKRKRSRTRPLTPTLERKIIADLRSEMPISMIATKHRVRVADVSTLNQRVYWLAYEDDPNVLSLCRLTEEEYRLTMGPRLTDKDAITSALESIERSNALIIDLLQVDSETADTIRKLVVLSYIAQGLTASNPGETLSIESESCPQSIDLTL